MMMETSFITGCCGGRKVSFMAKKKSLTEKITEYVETTMLSEIDPELTASMFESTPSIIKRILTSLEKKGLIRKSGNKWLR